MYRGHSGTIIGTLDMICLGSPLNEPIYTSLPTHVRRAGVCHTAQSSRHSELSPSAFHPSAAGPTNHLSALNLSFTVVLPLKFVNMFKTLFQPPASNQHHHCAIPLSFTSHPIFLKKFLYILSGFLRTGHPIL